MIQIKTACSVEQQRWFEALEDESGTEPAKLRAVRQWEAQRPGVDFSCADAWEAFWYLAKRRHYVSTLSGVVPLSIPMAEITAYLDGTRMVIRLGIEAGGLSCDRLIEGRVLKGRSAGGRVYGYRLVPGEEGTDYEIDPEQADVVRRIFAWYAAGWTHRWIAAELNRLGILGPRGSTWCETAIYGDMTKGTGLLNQELYIGRLRWNRRTGQRDPDSGKRTYRMRPPEEWVIVELPHLRIVPQELWDAVKARQQRQREQTEARRERCHFRAGPGRTPKYLFTGLVKCGTCGGNYTQINAYQYGCAKHRQRGETVCSNRLKAPRKLVESRLLGAIVQGLFLPEEVARFQEGLRRRLSSTDDFEAQREQLKKLQRKLDQESRNLVQAIKDGIAAQVVRDELERCERQKTEAQRDLANLSKAGVDARNLPAALDGYAGALEGVRRLAEQDVVAAREQIRTLVGEIRLIPHDGHLIAWMTGKLMGLLAVSKGDSELLVWRENAARSRRGSGAGSATSWWSSTPPRRPTMESRCRRPGGSRTGSRVI